MADQTIYITVTFDENGQPQWPAVPPIQMTGAGTITLHRAPKSDWHFTGFEFYAPKNPNEPTHPADFGTPKVHSRQIYIDDTDKTEGVYFYKYEIRRKGKNYRSPDPEIDNNPPP